MNNKQWIESNLEGKVKARALRACEEQPEWVNNDVESIAGCFYWRKTKEGEDYWLAIADKEPNPDKWLPENYVDVDHFVEPNEMVEDEFLTWLEIELEDPHEPSERHYTLMEVIEKYNELKTK
jgi:hypothetical protein